MRVLPEKLREQLKQPLGDLVNEQQLIARLHQEPYIVSIGDLVTYTVLKHGFSPRLCIVDYMIKREKYSPEMKEMIAHYGKTQLKVTNPAETLTDDLWDAIEWAFNHPEKGPVRIDVDGEEDLASLAAIYLAPPDATVIYGLPNKGVLVIKPTDAHKRKVQEVLDQM